MAPEQAMGRTIDMRTDVYALGVMAFEMLTGKQPFTGATTFEVLMKRVSEPPPLLRAFRPELGPAVEALLQQAMARDPVARWQTMKDVEAALVQIDDALDDRTADRRAQTWPIAAAIEEAPPTATSARHKLAPAGITLPPEASPGRAGERLAELLEAGDPTEAGTRVEERSAGRTVVAAAEAVPVERKHGTTIAIAAAVAALAVGGGAWWMLGRDDVGSREIAMGAEGSDASAKAARDELSRAANEADAEDEAAGADELVARPADDAEQRDDAGEGGGANADAHDAAEGGDADAAGDDAVQGGAADAAQQEDGKADESAGRKASSRGRARASRREPTPTVALVIGKLRRKARARCNADGVEVGVEFLVQESGATAMVRGTSSNGDSRLADCVVAVVEGTRFPAGDPRSRSLKVSL
jgi:serine/threonine-protein kinase